MTILSLENIMKLIGSVAGDLTDAKLYLNYVNSLDELIKKYPEVISTSFTFWSNTVKVYYDAMTMCLMRAYDQNNDNQSVGLKLLLQRIEENISLFSSKKFEDCMKKNENFIDQKYLFPDETQLKNQIQNHMKWVDYSNNKYVNSLRYIRNKSVFHRDEKVLYGERPDLEKIKASHEDITKLIDEGLRILNYYSQLFNRNTYIGHMVGYGDHEIIFKIVQNHSDSLLKKHRIEESLS